MSHLTVSAANHAIAPILFDATWLVHARQDGAHHRFDRELTLLWHGALGEKIPLKETLDQLHFRSSGVHAKRFDFWKRVRQRQPFLLIGRVLADELALIGKAEIPR